MILCMLLLTTISNRIVAQTDDVPQDIVVTNFELVPNGVLLDNVYDNNGDACALIKFSVRDTTFKIVPNLGYVKRESRDGEIRLYVPAGTKRLTVRHGGLFPLRNWQIPERIESKRMYHAYLWTTIDNDQKVGEESTDIKVNRPKKARIDEGDDEDEDEDEVDEKPSERTLRRRTFTNDNNSNDTEATEEKIAKNNTESKVGHKRTVHCYFGVGYSIPFHHDMTSTNSKTVRGESIMAGIDIKHHQIELGGLFTLDYSKKMYIYDNNTLLANKRYKMFRTNLHYGYEIRTKDRVHVAITPKMGLGLNYLKGDGTKSNDKYANASAFTFDMAMRFALCFGSVGIHVTPEYNVGIYESDLYKLVRKNNKVFHSWFNKGGMDFGLFVYL